MNERELKHCMFCGARGIEVCEGLTPNPGCKMSGLDARIAAHSTKPKGESEKETSPGDSPSTAA